MNSRRLAALSDERRTVDMLVMLLASGADANTLSPENRKCVLMEAVKRGPRPGRLCAVAIWC